ncbi:MAG: SAM-dependent methyltransferase [Proteobacteria bacterium]|nr:SAM-dependent methyltransferase [Pseudomonadota bacterium]
MKDWQVHMQATQVRTLPTPDADSAAHSAAVARHIRDKVNNAGGCISFAEYMHEVLYSPGLGYYSAGSAKFGAEGDFVTAPEISPVFGRVLARQCAQVLDATGGGSVLEFGAGSGKLAAEVLRKMAEIDALPDRYCIFEVSADLRDRQESFLNCEIPEFVDSVSWLNQLPEQHKGVVIANEVLDALPVERFVRRSDHVAQLCVTVDHNEFVIVEREAPAVLASAVAAIENGLGRSLAEGFVSEVCLAATGWIGDLAELLQEGVAFLFDYGVSQREYYAEDRSDGWLRCHFRHHAHNDALILPGIQDITAWVDFSAAAAAAHEHGLDVSGYVTQAHFLMNGGLADELANFSDLPPAAQMTLSSQVKLLTLPGEMGESFKCLGLSRNLDITPDSLASSDRAITL